MGTSGICRAAARAPAALLVLWALLMLPASESIAAPAAPRPAAARRAEPGERARPVAAGTAERIKEAFTRARRLFRQSRYQAAIRAFDEVKDLQYHPILDYGIAKCYEALDNLQSAIYYLQKYVRNLPRFTMSKRHPTIADAKVKIGVLEQRLVLKKRPAPRPAPPGPGPLRVVMPPPAPDVPPTRPPVEEVVPGPYPFDEPGPQQPPVVPPKPTYARKSVMLHFSIGGGTFTEDSSDNFIKPMNGVGGLTMAILWRFMPYLAVGPTARISGGVTGENFDDLDHLTAERVDSARFMYANIMLELRAFLPLGRVDIWAALALGYASLSRTHSYRDSSVPDSETTLRSVGVGGKVGLDIFTGESFSLGFRVAFMGTVPVHKCITDQDCVKPVDRDKPGLHWYLGLTLTWHLRLSSIVKPEPRPRARRR
ncbi:MAG: tetratricopeptide repeat protein [bacterium]